MNIDKLIETYVVIDDSLKDFMPYLDQCAEGKPSTDSILDH